MALRGETIGTAFVRVLADGDGFDESLREQFRTSEGGFKQLGRTHSEAYDEGWNEQIDELTPKIIKGLEAGIRRNAGRFDAAGQQIADGTFDPIERQLKHRFGDELGEEMTQQMKKAFFRSGGSVDVVDNFVEHIEEKFVDLTDANEKQWKEQTEKIKKMVEEQADHLVKIEDERAREVSSIRREEATAALNSLKTRIKVQDEMWRKEAAAWEAQRKIERDTQVELRKTESEFRRLTATVEKFHRSTDADRTTRRRLLDDMDRLGERIRFLGGDTQEFERNFGRMRRELVTTRPILTRVTNLFDNLGDGVGRAFGKGSRSEFLNFSGRVIGFFAGLPGLVTRATQKIINFSSNIRAAFQESTMKGLQALGSSLATGVAGFIALGAVMLIVAGTAGILSSAILSLVGALTAMVASLAFAAGGGIAVLAASFLPLIAMIGLTILAFKDMDKETSKAFSNIKKTFKDLGKDISRNIFDSPTKDAEALEKAIKDLETITGPVSKALGGLFDEFIADLNSPLWERFRKQLGDILPGQVTSIGHIFEALTNGIIGLFIAIAPYTDRFLNWVEEISNKFAKWANKPAEKNGVKSFMDEAFESATAVGKLIGSIIGLIGDLFGASKNTGDNIFTDLSSTIDGWRVKIEQAREDGTLQAWFEDAKRTAGAIANAIVEIAKFIEKLDTPANRQLVRDIANAFIELVGTISEAWMAFQMMGSIFRGIYNGIIGPVLSTMLHALANVLDLFGDLFSVLGKVPGMHWAKELGDDLHTAAAEADAAADAVRRIPQTWNVKVNVTWSEATVKHMEDRLGAIRGRQVAVDSGVLTADVTGAVTPVPGSKTVIVQSMTINTPTEDPVAVASEVVNRFAAAAYV